MEALRMKRHQKVTWDYDEEADVLYLSFGKPQPALTLDLGNGVLARYREEDSTLLGFTILGVSHFIKEGAQRPQ